MMVKKNHLKEMMVKKNHSKGTMKRNCPIGMIVKKLSFRDDDEKIVP